MTADLTKLTVRQLARSYNSLLRTIRRECADGATFGVDRPTLRITRPDLAGQLDALESEARRRTLPARP